MGSGILNVSVSGLNAAQMGILTTSHNIANASTAGFNRQTIIQTTNTPMFSGAGFIGQGASVETVRRVYSEFLSNQVKNAEANAAELSTYASQIAQIDNLLADPSAGLSPALQSFFSAVSAAAADPASVPSRQAMLSAGQALVGRFRGLDQQLTDIRDGLNTQLRAEVGTINSYVNQIADINERIVLAQAAGSIQPANDLYDQRDRLISDLNKEIRTTVHQETDGSMSVFFGSGQPLVVGNQIYELKAVPDQEDLTRVQIALKSPNGTLTDIPESLLTGGTIAGLLNFRSGTLDAAQNSIGRIALAMATTFNSQHALGQDLDGDMGGNFFQPITLSTLGAPANKGDATIDAYLTVSDYKVTYNQREGYIVTSVPDDAYIGTFNGLPEVIAGVRISLAAGTPADGDTFLIRPGEAPAERVVPYQRQDGSLPTATLASTGSNIQTLSDSDFRLTYSATNTMMLVRLSDQKVWSGTGGTPTEALSDLMSKAAPQGFDLKLNGTMQIGDSFLIRPARTAARDIALAVTDARDLALGSPIRTSAGLTNAGTAVISPGTVIATSVPQQAPFTVSYEASSGSLIGFPVGSTILVGSTTYKIDDVNMRVPYSSPAEISLNGVGARIAGTPADGDTFTIGADTHPPIAPPAIGNTGFAKLFGLPTNSTIAGGTQGVATGGISHSYPVAITAGNNSFNAVVKGTVVTAMSVTLANVNYDGSAPGKMLSDLALDIETKINATLAAVVPAIPDRVDVTVDASNRIVITTTPPAAGSAVSLSNASNSGTATIVAGTVTSRASLPSAPIVLTYHQPTVSPVQAERLTGFPVGTVVTVTPPYGRPATYTIGQATDSVPYTSGATIAFNGMSFTISGPAVEGDTFRIGPNTSGVADSRNAALLGALQTKGTMADASATYQSSYSQVVSRIGNKAREIEVTLAAQEKLVTQGNDAIQSQSGVNLDEEAANLLRYQQAYQAAAKIINISGKLFDTLLDLGY